MISDNQIDELEKSIDECLFPIPVCDQLLDDIPTLVQAVILPILIDAHVLDFIMFSEIATPVQIQQSEY